MNSIDGSTGINLIRMFCGKAFKRPDKIIEIVLNDDCVIEISDVKEINSVIGNIGREKKHKILLIAGAYTNIGPEVMRDSNNPQNFKYILANAVVVQSFHQRLLANFYVNVIKPPIPTKYFKEKEEAVKWLLELTD